MIKYPQPSIVLTNEDAKAVYELFGTGYLTQGSITKKYEQSYAKSLVAIMQ